MNKRRLSVFLLVIWLVFGLALLAMIAMAVKNYIGKDTVTKFVWIYLFGSIVMSAYLSSLRKK